MRMLALLAMPLLVAAADAPRSIDGLPIGALPPQSLPASGCAAYLFTTGPTRAFVAMATQSPAALILAPGGKAVTLAQATVPGAAAMPGAAATTGRGFPASATFASGAISATLAMTVSERADVTGGAMVPDASLTVTPAGKDSVVIPLAGLVACRS